MRPCRLPREQTKEIHGRGTAHNIAKPIPVDIKVSANNICKRGGCKTETNSAERRTEEFIVNFSLLLDVFQLLNSKLQSHKAQLNPLEKL
jgi:hypothetical protein